ncbi:MAG: septum formation initiator family protein [Saprospiraceae bacterium]|nr:septum formation initiator family protein [Saprospiraceae bacterium]
MNKYVVVTFAFLVWMLFFDKNGIPTNINLKDNIANLEATKAEYEEKIVEALAEKKEIEENKEKYAREKYLMHKENEDVIVIEKK